MAKQSQFENDMMRLKSRTELVVGSFDGAPKVRQGYIDEARRHFQHAFLYLKAAIEDA